MYKSARKRIEDAIIPFMIEGVMRIHNDDSCLEYIAALAEDVKQEIGGDLKLYKRLARIEKKLQLFYLKNDWKTNKIFMILTALAESLYKQEEIALSDKTLGVLTEIDKAIVDGYECMPGIQKLDESAFKQVPKVFKLLQEEGLF